MGFKIGFRKGRWLIMKIRQTFKDVTVIDMLVVLLLVFLALKFAIFFIVRF